MNTRIALATSLIALLSTGIAVAGDHEIRILHITDRVGDVDNFHPGDASDIPRRSAAIVQALALSETTPAELDEARSNRSVGFTHAFDLPAAGQITGAVLTVRVTSADELVSTDVLILDPGVRAYNEARLDFPRTNLEHLLGFKPVAGVIYDLKVDLSHVPVVYSDYFPLQPDGFLNLLPELADGRLDVLTGDDVMVDASRLTVHVAVPCSGRKCSDDRGEDKGGAHHDD